MARSNPDCSPFFLLPVDFTKGRWKLLPPFIRLRMLRSSELEPFQNIRIPSPMSPAQIIALRRSLKMSQAGFCQNAQCWHRHGCKLGKRTSPSIRPCIEDSSHRSRTSGNIHGNSGHQSFCRASIRVCESGNRRGLTRMDPGCRISLRIPGNRSEYNEIKKLFRI